jgi:hypothetical protein
MVSMSVKAVTGMRSKETERGVCHFHDNGDQSKVLTSGMHIFKHRGKGCEKSILKDTYFGLGLGTEFCVAITRIE